MAAGAALAASAASNANKAWTGEQSWGEAAKNTAIDLGLTFVPGGRIAAVAKHARSLSRVENVFGAFGRISDGIRRASYLGKHRGGFGGMRAAAQRMRAELKHSVRTRAYYVRSVVQAGILARSMGYGPDWL